MVGVRCLLIGLLVSLAGCSASPGTSGKGSATSGDGKTTIRLLVVDDDDLAASIGEQWKTRSIDDELEIRTTTSKELSEAKRLSSDVVVFPARWMGELAERELIQPVPDAMLKDSTDAPALIKVDDLLTTVRQCDVSWGRKVYAVTLGSPQLVLLYRPDVFKHLNLNPPSTWSEYQAAVEKLADRAALGDLAPPAESPWHAALEPTAEGWAGVMLLARSAAAVRTEGQMFALFNIDDMSARIASPPFVQAARQLAEAAQTSGVSSDKGLTPGEVREAFLRGECGMAITWPAASKAKESKTPIAFAELPGQAETYVFQSQAWTKRLPDTDVRASLSAVSGRLAAVTREARRSRTAFQFLAWLSSGDTVRAVAPASPHTTLFTRTQLSNPGPWVGSASSEAANQYAEVARTSFGRDAWMSVVRLPGVDSYHAALDEAVRKTLADPEQAEPALQAAAKRWDEITRGYDITQQRRAYQRSLGNDY